MNKRIISILLVFIILGILGVYTHTAILEKLNIEIPFSLEKLYLFLTGFSILICVNLQLLSRISKIAEQLGIIYLGTLLLKFILFAAVFYQTIIKQENLALTTKISLLIPIFLFLIVEVFFVSKILNKSQ